MDLESVNKADCPHCQMFAAERNPAPEIGANRKDGADLKDGCVLTGSQQSMPGAQIREEKADRHWLVTPPDESSGKEDGGENVSSGYLLA